MFLRPIQGAPRSLGVVPQRSRRTFSISERASKKEPNLQTRYRHLVKQPTPSINQEQLYSPQSSALMKAKWARLSALIATCTGAGLGIFWATCRDEVPIIGRTRFNCEGFHLLRGSKSYPTLFWPDDHPTTVAVRKVLDRLLLESGIDPSSWKLYIIATPAYNDAIATMKGELIICSGSLSFCRDEACLASLMSSKIGHVVTKQPCEGLSNYYFAREAAIPAVQYIVTALFLPTVWFLAVPYILLYGCYLHHEQESLLRDIGEADYIALLMMHRAGYDMKAGLEFLVKNMAVGEMALALKTKLSGPDDNVVKALTLGLITDRICFQRKLCWIPEIEKREEGREIEKQVNKLLPKEEYVPEGGGPQIIQWQNRFSQDM